MFRSPSVRLVRALAVVGLLGTSAFLCRSLGAGEDSPPPEAPTLLRLTLQGSVRETAAPFSLFGGGGAHLRDIVDEIQEAANDPKTAGLVLRIRSPELGWTQAQALRRALLEFRRSGKPSYCHLRTAGTKDYLIASACGEVSLLPSGSLEVPGLGLGRIYLAGLLEKLGVRIQELRMGRYKSAVESLVRKDPSDAVREESQAILDDLFDDLVGAIAENRGIRPVSVRALVDKALYLPREALEAGLVDHIEYEDEFVSRITKPGDTTRQIVDARLGEEVKLEISGFAGLMALVNRLLSGPARAAPSTEPKIAVVEGVGAIVTGNATGDLFGGAVMGADPIVDAFRRARDDDTVRAVVFRVDSPGGSALASDLIWRAVCETVKKKPVVVSMGDMAASGGYYVSCGASWIVAENGTLTGSIGVIGAVPDLSGLFDLLDIHATYFYRGRRAGSTSPAGRLSDEGRDALLRFMRAIYDDFVSKVATGRRLPKEAVEAIAEGRVWTGKRAKELGLVDEIGGFEHALARARALADVPADAKLLILPKQKSLFEILGGLDTGVLEAWRPILRSLPAEIQPLLRELEWLQSIGTEHAFLVRPDLSFSR